MSQEITYALRKSHSAHIEICIIEVELKCESGNIE